MQIPSLLLKILESWVTLHPDATLGLILLEVIISAIASELPMPLPTSPAAYKAVFVVMTGLAINRARISAALGFWRATPGMADGTPKKG